MCSSWVQCYCRCFGAALSCMTSWELPKFHVRLSFLLCVLPFSEGNCVGRDQCVCSRAFFAALRHVFFYWKNTDIALRSSVQYQGFVQSDIAWRCAPPPSSIFGRPPSKLTAPLFTGLQFPAALLQTAKDQAPTRAAVRHTRFPEDARGLYSQHDT